MRKRGWYFNQKGSSASLWHEQRNWDKGTGALLILDNFFALTGSKAFC